MNTTLRGLIDRGPMRPFQWGAIATVVLLNIIDGFDVLVMAFTAGSVAEEWQLSPGIIGTLLSSGLVGMALGALIVAPFADRIGRRRTILICLGIVSVGMLLSSISQEPLLLGATRVLTGIGVGGILANSSVVSAEYSSAKWRGLAVSLMTLGYAIGATFGGLLSVLVIENWGWRAVFLIGGLASLVIIPVVLFALPESMDFLATRRPPNALEKVRRLAGRMGLPAPRSWDDVGIKESESRGVFDGFRMLLQPRHRRVTLLLWGAFFFIMAGFYFVTSWTPTLLMQIGMSQGQGLTGGTLLNLGGMASGAIFGLLAAKWRVRTVLIGFLLFTALALVLFVASLTSLAVALAIGVLVGIGVNGCVAGFYALTPALYPSGVRATGVGTVIGIGRIGAIVAPALAGFLLEGGWTPQNLYVGCALVFLLGIGMLVLLRPADQGDSAAVLNDSREKEQV